MRMSTEKMKKKVKKESKGDFYASTIWKATRFLLFLWLYSPSV